MVLPRWVGVKSRGEAVYEVLIEIDELARLPNKHLWSLIDQVIEAAVSDGVHIRYCTYHESRVAFGGIMCQIAQQEEHDSLLPLKLPNCDPADYLLVAPFAYPA